jgi:hypothetical protein
LTDEVDTKPIESEEADNQDCEKEEEGGAATQELTQKTRSLQK